MNITINNTEYQFIKNYKDIDKYRLCLNALTKKTYGFDFEQWYQDGYWQEKYLPYSLIHNETVVANVSVNPIDFLVCGTIKHTIQIGTVMTDKAYRNQGLIRALMNIILDEYENCSDLIYLFANDSVLEFYPKFGFKKAVEYKYSKALTKQQTNLDTINEIINTTHFIRKLNIDISEDRLLLTKLINNATPISKVSMLNNPGLILFYCTSFMKDLIYYIEDLDVAIVAEIDSENINIIDIFSEKVFDLDLITNSLITNNTMEIHYSFTPLDTTSFNKELLEEENTTLFVKGNNFLNNAMFPVLSHA